jgi:prepilin-type N-terminal cleavage/methylation domain-containing protein
MDKTRGNYQKGGFTLVELLIVITIISILASLSTIYYMKYRDKSLLASHALPLADACAKDIITYCIELNPDSPTSIDVQSLNLLNCQNTQVQSQDLKINVEGSFVCNPGGNVTEGKVEAYLEDVKDYKAVCYLEDNALRCNIENSAP